MLTQAKLKENLHYDQFTGVFTWVKIKQGRKASGFAGCKNDKGYITIMIAGTSYRAHKLAWLHLHGELPNSEIDHINGDRSDNRIINLRQCTRAENLFNTKIHTNNKTGFKGVVLRDGKYCAQATLHGKTKYLGAYLTPEKASCEYEKFARMHHGEFFNPVLSREAS